MTTQIRRLAAAMLAFTLLSAVLAGCNKNADGTDVGKNDSPEAQKLRQEKSKGD